MSKRAILSVYNKEGLVTLARRLAAAGWELVASGGSARTLRDAELPVTEISALTGAPEMLGGRVKTLHPAIHAGILARDSDDDRAELAQHGFAPIDLVVCNLYPFAATIAQDGVTVTAAVEQIDIGGVTLLRAAAKNFARVTVVVDPADYRRVARAIEESGAVPEPLRRELARKAFAHTRDYDTAIAAYLSTLDGPPSATGPLPDRLHLSLQQVQPLRYGENPHQAAALYAPAADAGPLGGTLLQGKPLSYNNLLDLDAACQAVLAFDDPAVVIVKHLSPCGIAVDPMNAAAAFPAALASDPVSAFGGVIAVNRPVESSFATAVGDADLFVEAIVAPSFSPGAQKWFADHKANCRLVALGDDVDFAAEPTRRLELRAIRNGYLVQEQDVGDPEGTSWEMVSARQPGDEELEALRFAWQAVTFVKSNAIVLATARATVGIGGGLPSRVDAVHLAVRKAGGGAAGAVMASDAFFPFPDSIEAAAAAGVTAIIQPGGSIRDDEVIAAADRLGLAMVFTGSRHFRH
ncbi:MAG: bifunctional phosphoribosylaminoimidazolecarboxamide formyltransferase/IMP cyclohydrolase [Anaerolineae bacterium]|nr:bifunctional phosphoribosylaminoimidazolecarboxamide formyltransferase/IMP cyclohydrolase [Anaerolineae bacterium]